MMKILASLILLFVLFCNQCHAGGGGGSRYVNTGSYNGPGHVNKSIYDPLLDDAFKGYNPLAIPICKKGKPLHLMIDMWLYQLFDLDEPKQELTMDVWVDMTWRDCSISWDPVKYNGIKQLTLPSHDVWFPDIFAYQGLHGNYEEGLWVFRESKVKVMYNGMMQLGAQLLLKTFCRVNIKDFPYDSQECPITFSAWNKDLSSFNMTSKPNHGDNKGHSFAKASNGEWEVGSLVATNNVQKFHVGLDEKTEEEYSEVTFKLQLSRKPKFIQIYLIFPCVLLIWVATIGFLLPVSSGEKIGLVSTVLLSLVVFLLVVADNVPHTSDSIPLVAKFFFACISLVTLAMVFTTIVLNVSHKSELIAMPPCFKSLLDSGFASFFCVSKLRKREPSIHVSKTEEPDPDVNATNAMLLKERHRVDSDILVKREPHHEKPESDDWMAVGLLIDRVALFVYSMLCLFLTAYMIVGGILNL